MNPATYLLFLILIKESSSTNLKVFNFGSDPDSELVIPVDSSKTLTLGFTICFRMKLRNWSDARIFKSENNLQLLFYHYKYDAGGTLTFGTSAKHFEAIYDISKFNTWQPFCLTYDARSYSSRLFIDGKKIMEPGNITGEKGKPFSFGNTITFGSSSPYLFLGNLTDLNIWSR